MSLGFDILLSANHAVELLEKAGLSGPPLLVAGLLSPQTASHHGIPAGVSFNYHYVSAAADRMRKIE